MNANISTLTTIANLPKNAKTTVLYAMVGSLNARIIGGSQRIVQFLDRNNADVHQEINEQFLSVQADAEARAQHGTGVNTFIELVAMNSYREQLREMLMEATNDDEPLPLSGTLKFMTESVKSPSAAALEACAHALQEMGEDITAEELGTIHRLDAEQQRIALAGMSERVLDVALSIPVTRDEDIDFFDKLSPQAQRSLLTKLHQALNTARNKVFQGMIRGSGTADLGDLPLIRAAITEVAGAIQRCDAEPEQESAPNASTIGTEPKAKRNLRRVPAETK